MCLNNFKEVDTSKPVIGYKIERKAEYKWRSLFQGFAYKIGKKYKTHIKKNIDMNTFNICITEGFHAYKTPQYPQDLIQEITKCNLRYNTSEEYRIVKCEFPSGCTLYEGVDDERIECYAGDKIKITGIVEEY